MQSVKQLGPEPAVGSAGSAAAVGGQWGLKVDDGQAPLNSELGTPGVGEGPGSGGCVELSEIHLAK